MCEEKEETEEGIVTTILSDYGWRITMKIKKIKLENNNFSEIPHLILQMKTVKLWIPLYSQVKMEAARPNY